MFYCLYWRNFRVRWLRCLGVEWIGCCRGSFGLIGRGFPWIRWCCFLECWGCFGGGLCLEFFVGFFGIFERFICIGRRIGLGLAFFWFVFGIFGRYFRLGRWRDLSLEGIVCLRRMRFLWLCCRVLLYWFGFLVDFFFFLAAGWDFCRDCRGIEGNFLWFLVLVGFLLRLYCLLSLKGFERLGRLLFCFVLGEFIVKFVIGLRFLLGSILLLYRCVVIVYLGIFEFVLELLGRFVLIVGFIEYCIVIFLILYR